MTRGAKSLSGSKRRSLVRPFARALSTRLVFLASVILAACARPPVSKPPERTTSAVPRTPPSLPSKKLQSGLETTRDVSSEFVRLSWFEALTFAKERTNWLTDVETPKTIEEVKTRLCVESSGDASAPPEPATCEGPVWRVTFDHLHYSDHTLILIPLGDDVVVYDAGMIGGGMCWGSQSSSLLSLEVLYREPELILTFTNESYDFNVETSECLTLEKTTTEVRYDTKSGRGASREL